MNQWPDLFANLDNEKSDKIWHSGQDERIPAGTTLIEEGKPVDTMYFVIEGVLHVTVHELGDHPIAVRGPGEIVGEMSFIDPHPSSATIVTAEESHVFAIPHTTFRETLENDSVLAAHIYKAFSIIGARRLRNTMRRMAGPSRDALQKELGKNEEYQKLFDKVASFKSAMIELDKLDRKNKQKDVEELENAILEEFNPLVDEFNELIGDKSPLSDPTKQEIGLTVQREVLPYILMTSTSERMYTKPRGYAGDFYTIELVYREEAGGFGRIGPLVDRCVFGIPAAVAVRNRRPLMAREIQKTIDQAEGTAHIMSMACGPAREIFDVFDSLDKPNKLKCTLVDMDLQALSFVDSLATEKGLRRRMDLTPENLIYLALGRKKLNIPPQDLVYSIGLIDYFSDDLVLRLINYTHSILKEGGRVILGNFHPDNSTKAFMDWVLDWKLIHRTEEDMNRLFEKSAFGRPTSNIYYEPQRINLFAECVKEG